MVTIRHERPCDIAAREALLDASFGHGRQAKTCERLREGRLPAFALVAAVRGHVIGTVRLWHVAAGAGRPALLLGPLAVDAAWRGFGIGAALMERAVAAAREAGHCEILLVGDAPYYARFGFSAARTGALALPGPFEPARLLSLKLDADSAAEAGLSGMVTATGAVALPAVRGRRVRRAALSHAA
jgi:predicted N-acetyltransferase YhbS